jgi:hypothetical protein
LSHTQIDNRTTKFRINQGPLTWLHTKTSLKYPNMPHLQRKYPCIFICILSVCIFLVIFALFVGLTPLGQWEDEYSSFASLTNSSFFAWNAALIHWIPRPVSNLALGIYGFAVVSTQHPLVASVLLTLWIGLFACVTLSPFFFFRKYGWGDRGLLFSLGLALMSVFLLGHPISDAFYWPQAALAYLPTLGSISIIFWVICADRIATTGGLERYEFILSRIFVFPRRGVV